jgi:hypothetical protein
MDAARSCFRLLTLRVCAILQSRTLSACLLALLWSTLSSSTIALAQTAPPAQPPPSTSGSSTTTAPAEPAAATAAQPTDAPVHQHEPTGGGSSWHVMQDAVIFATWNEQGGLRGSNGFISQNWWMGMASRPVGRSTLTITGMLSLEPITTEKRGYAELFQVGETYDGAPLVDYQHPHDFLMQFSAVFKIPLSGRTALRLTAAPVGEAGVGPPAFMHRRSSAENPIAPLSHHSFDSTHITMGVVGVGLDLGPISLDGSAFHAREPDEQRWDIMDPGKLDSWAGRLTLRPMRGLEIQGSYAFLHEPEALERQDVKRTTGSISWTREGRGDNYTAFTFAAGRNRRTYSQSDALLGEITHRVGRVSVFSRYEGVEVETEHLLFPGLIHTPHAGELIDPLHAVTLGGVFELPKIGGWELGLGGDTVLYNVPTRLQATHGERPVSYHVFLRVRAPKSPMGRMWNMRMSDGMRH